MQTQESQAQFVRRWALVALVYFVAAVALGVAMAASHDHRLKGVHVHVNMLGWVSMAVTAFVYRLFPAAIGTWGSKLHFWLYNLALPVMAVSLGGLLLGDARFEPVVAASSVAVLIAVLVFVVNVFIASRNGAGAAAGEHGLWKAL